MNTPNTAIRLIEPGDAEAVTAHRVRDTEAMARWDPERPPDFYTVAGQRERIITSARSMSCAATALSRTA